jgi:TonB family protein
MPQAPETIEIDRAQLPISDLRLLIVSDPWWHNFLRNLREVFSAVERIPPESEAAAFWPDVFVHRGLPWWRFLQSAAYHVAAILMIWAGSRFLALQPRATSQPTFTHADVLYYTASEYLRPIDTRRADSPPVEKPDPKYSAQPIISLPPEAENRSQTIVTPPAVKLHRDVALPNVIAWSDKPQVPIAPVPVVLASETSRLAPKVEQSVVIPPPEVANSTHRSIEENAYVPQLAVIAPPPQVQVDSSRRFGDLEVGHSTVIAPAPQLSLDAQRAGRPAASLGAQSMRVIAPPPSVGTYAGARSDGNVIALSLHPSVTAPVEAVRGNRRGSVATTAQGRPGATGAPGNVGAWGKGEAGELSKGRGDLPTGLYVGKAANTTSVSGDRPTPRSNSYAVNPNLLADAKPPRVSSRKLGPETSTKLSEEERAVFGGRRFYSLSLNMPNLNSAGGSWIIRFAAFNAEPGSRDANERGTARDTAAKSEQDLSAPSATRKVDPAYPLELMRQNIGGTVILYAVIRTDGKVGNIRVLRSVDRRLDYYASQAIAKWQFEPATKNYVPVDVEATFWIPFRPAKTSAGF